MRRDRNRVYEKQLKLAYFGACSGTVFFVVVTLSEVLDSLRLFDQLQIPCTIGIALFILIGLILFFAGPKPTTERGWMLYLACSLFSGYYMIGRWQQFAPRKDADAKPAASTGHSCRNGHIMVRLNGYGHTVIPHYPYEFRRVENGVLVTHLCGDRTFGVVISPGDSGLSIELADGTPNLSEVADITEDGHPRPWMLETSMWSCAWPKGVHCRSADFAAFALQGDHEEMIYVQTPERMPESLEKLVAPGQQVISIDEAESAIVLEYEHDSQAWRQRQDILCWQPPFSVTTQSPVDHFAVAESAAKIVRESIVPSGKAVHAEIM